MILRMPSYKSVGVNLLCLLMGLIIGYLLQLTPLKIQPETKEQEIVQSVFIESPIPSPTPEIKQPSERALLLAATIFQNANATYLEKYKTRYASQSAEENKSADAIRGMAFSMDDDPAVMASAQAYVDKIKANAGKPEVHVESQTNPPVITSTPYNPPTYTAPKSFNCTSSTVGSQTYTNCN